MTSIADLLETVFSDIEFEVEPCRCSDCRLAAGGAHVGSLHPSAREALKNALEQAYKLGWKEALWEAEIATIAAPAALKTTGNVPTYYMDRAGVIDAIRSKSREEE